MKFKIYKKILYRIIWFFFFLSCTNHHLHYKIIINSDFNSEGFLNNEIFQVKSFGIPYPDTLSLINRRKQAIKNAYANALERAIDMIIGEVIKKNQDKYPEFELEIVPDSIPLLRSVIRKKIINGNIIKKEFHSDGSCSLVYRIEMENLKDILLNMDATIRKKVPH